MSHRNQGNIPVKRRPGRQRKNPLPNNQNMNSEENAAGVGIPPVPPGFERKNTGHQPHDEAFPVNESTDIRVGSVVCGFIEGEFEDGFLVTIRGGRNFPSPLRGVVYKPGRYVPVSPQNDVAPDLPMIPRYKIPDFPASASASMPSAPPPSDRSTPENQAEGREFDMAACNQPSTEMLLQAEANSIRLPQIVPFEKLVAEVVKRTHHPP